MRKRLRAKSLENGTASLSLSPSPSPLKNRGREVSPNIDLDGLVTLDLPELNTNIK